MQKGFDVVNLHGTASGVIAVPVIGENGNWWIGNEDTGIAARGQGGEPGPKGDAGDSAYQVAVKNGFEGTEKEWLESLKGKDGTGSESEVLGMTLLFDGFVRYPYVEKEIKLLGPVTDYSILLAETCMVMTNSEGAQVSYYHKTYVIVNPIMGGEYHTSAYTYGKYAIGDSHYGTLEFTFSDSETLFLNGGNTNLTKIYGIK